MQAYALRRHRCADMVRPSVGGECVAAEVGQRAGAINQAGGPSNRRAGITVTGIDRQPKVYDSGSAGHKGRSK